MRRSRLTLATIFIFAGILFSFLGSPVVLGQAQYAVGPTYFSGQGPSGYTPLTANYADPLHGATYSMWGSVMPNLSNKALINGGGAIGTDALGVGVNAGKGATAVPGPANQALKAKFYDFLKNKYTSGSDWEKMGVALIAHQMTGKPSASSGGSWGESYRTVSTTVWNDLEARINDPTLVMQLTFRSEGGGYSMRNNTIGVKNNNNGTFDAVDYYVDTNWKVDSWIFHYSNPASPVYVLEIECANPLGRLGGLPPYEEPSNQYSLEPTLEANRPSGSIIERGESISVTSSVLNNGPNNSNPTTWQITRLSYNSSTNPTDGAQNSENDACGTLPTSGRTGCTDGRTLTGEEFNTGPPRRGDPLTYTIPADAAYGSKVCFVASVSTPTQNASPRWRHSAIYCVTVASPSYTLVPTVSLDKDKGAVAEPGEPTIVTSTVRNEGSDRSEPAIWRVTRMVYAANKAWGDGEKSGRSDDREPCNSFPTSGRLAGAQQCRTVLNGERTNEFDPGQTLSFNIPDSIHDDAQVGEEVCFAVSVSRPTFAANPVWRHSDLWCLKVGKRPKLQVWGGDVRSGGKIDTSISTIMSIAKTYGSWGEYGALSNGKNSGFSSGSGLNSDTTNGSSSQSTWSKLTFANTGTTPDCAFGCYNFSLSSEGLIGQFDSSSTPPLLSGGSPVDLNALPGGTKIYRAGNITLSGTTIAPGRTIILLATGAVTIDGNILYDNDGVTNNGYTSAWDIPQVIIRAPTINIRNNASQVDAWLLAVSDSGTGILNTCSYDNGRAIDPTEPLSASMCGNRLIVNGPVVTDTILLKRTAGSGGRADQRGEPAEIFNLRADAYLWASTQDSGYSRVQTVDTKELSPRF